jgi:hypothetical protein
MIAPRETSWPRSFGGAFRSVQRLDGRDRHRVVHGMSESIIECDQCVGLELGQGDGLGVEGVDPAQLVCDRGSGATGEPSTADFITE